MPKENKSTQVKFAERENKVYELLLSGWRTVDIIKYVRENYGVTHKQAEIYLANARTLIKEQSAERRKMAFEAQSARIELIFQKGLETGDLRVCLEALRENGKLHNLYESDKKLFDLDKIVIERQLITFNQNIRNISNETVTPETE